MTISGIGFSGRGQNNGMVFVKLKDWELRDRPDLKVEAVAGRAMGAFSGIRNAMVFAFPPPAVIELGTRQGVRLPAAGPGRPRPRQADGGPQPAPRHGRQGPAPDARPAQRPGGRARIPDRRGLGKGRRPGGAHHFDPQHDLGGLRQRLCQRLHPGRPGQDGSMSRPTPPTACCPRTWKSSTSATRAGKMVPFSSFASGHWTSGSPQLERFNGFPSMNIWGEPAPGRSSGEAMQAMEEIVGEAAAGDRLRLDRALLPGADVQLPGAACCTPSPSS